MEKKDDLLRIGVVTTTHGIAGEVKVFGKDQCHQNEHCRMNLTAWDIIAYICIDLRMVGMGGDPFLVPRCDVQQDNCSQDCYQCEPPDGALSEGQDYERCQKRPECISAVASYLEYRLRQAFLSSRCHLGHSGSLRMKY